MASKALVLRDTTAAIHGASERELLSAGQRRLSTDNARGSERPRRLRTMGRRRGNYLRDRTHLGTAERGCRCDELRRHAEPSDAAAPSRREHILRTKLRTNHGA
jgi:hypothetical protein